VLTAHPTEAKRTVVLKFYRELYLKLVMLENPVYTYSKPGAYMVCLTAFDKINVLAESTCKEIRVGTESCIIGSDFSYFIDPLAREVDFSSLAKGVVDSYFWTFGDGGSSTEINPSHYFAIPGLYKISLAVRNSVGNCLDISTEYIQVGSVDCRAGFTFKVDANTNLVNYQDDSKGEISYYYWELGDGSFSVSKEVGHLYKKAGIYTVGQTVIDDVNGCMDYIVQPVQVGEVNCAADFMSYIDAATSTVYYTNKVMGEATALYWSFGDGKFSTLQNPVHQFVSEGFYSTGLNTYDFNSGCMDYYQETLMIGEMGIDCNADFIYSVDADNGNVLFSNTSIGDVVQWLWNFGDGSENSAEINPEHMYSKSGYYNVCLNIVNSSGTKNMGCKWVAVDVTSDNNCRANFMFTLDSSTRVVKFVDNSFGDIDKYTWDFGDSKADSVSADQNPSHSYSQKGYYLVQLKVEDNTSGCMSNEYKLLNVAESQVLKASFGYEAKDLDKKVAGYPVDLVSASSGDGATVEWDFGDKSVKKELFTVMDSTSRIVTHYYQKPGKYLVCLRITDPVSGQSDVLCKHVFTKNWTSMVDLESMQSITLDVFPNPFVDFTNFEYTLPQAQSVELAIFDQLGRRIETIAKTTMEPGVHQIVWESKSLRSGIYHVKLITKGSIVTKQLVITK